MKKKGRCRGKNEENFTSTWICGVRWEGDDGRFPFERRTEILRRLGSGFRWPRKSFFLGRPDPTRPLLGEQIPPFRRTAKHPSGPIKDRTRDASRCEDVLLLSLSFPDLSRLRQVGKGNCEETSQTLHIRGMHLPRPYTKFHYRIVNYFFIYLP